MHRVHDMGSGRDSRLSTVQIQRVVEFTEKASLIYQRHDKELTTTRRHYRANSILYV